MVVSLSDGSHGTVSVPSGASVGKNEALEMRDKDEKKFCGYGVTNAVNNVNTLIAEALVGRSPYDQKEIDDVLTSLDGTSNMSRLGANATVGTSIAMAKAAAASLRIPLYKYIGGIAGCELPIPLVNVINGGLHADNGLDFQEFMIVPVGATSFSHALRMCAEVFMKLKEVLQQRTKYKHG